MRTSKWGTFSRQEGQRPPSRRHPIYPTVRGLRLFPRRIFSCEIFVGNFLGTGSVRMSVALFQPVRRFVAQENSMRDDNTLFPSPPSTNNHDDGIDRRGMLKCMAWVGTGLVWGMSGGVATSRVFGQAATNRSSLSFVQISDSHLGFSRAPNKDVAGTLKQTIARINALPEPPAFILHTGDITHSARPEEFDAVAQLLKEVKTGKVLYVPGEHDFDGEGNKEYLKRYGQGTIGTGWYSFDYQGVHFIALVNVASAKSGSG